MVTSARFLLEPSFTTSAKHATKLVHTADKSVISGWSGWAWSNNGHKAAIEVLLIQQLYHWLVVFQHFLTFCSKVCNLLLAFQHWPHLHQQKISFAMLVDCKTASNVAICEDENTVILPSHLQRRFDGLSTLCGPMALWRCSWLSTLPYWMAKSGRLSAWRCRSQSNLPRLGLQFGRSHLWANTCQQQAWSKELIVATTVWTVHMSVPMKWIAIVPASNSLAMSPS